MKIVIATSVYYPQINGVAVFSHNLATGLSKAGHEVLVIAPSRTGKRASKVSEGVREEKLKSSKIYFYPDQVHKVPSEKKIIYKNSLRASILPARQIKKILDEFQPDVIHVQGSDPIGVFAVRYAHKHDIPVVLTEHNQPEVLTESLPLPKFLRKLSDTCLTSYFRSRQKKVDFVTMPTELAISHLLEGKDLGVPVEAVSNGVDLTSFYPGEAPSNLYNLYEIPRGVPIILYIGRLDPEKKVSVALKAFAEFLDKHKLDSLSKTLFVVVGDGTDKNNLVSLVSKMGISESVKFLGRVVGDDLYNIYRMGSVFVTASEIETQGIVLIEAAATGLPLIAVDAGAVKEICQDGKNGILIKPGDASAMAEAMDTVLSDSGLAGQMSERSVRIAKNHDLKKTVEKFVEIYKKVCYNKKS